MCQHCGEEKELLTDFWKCKREQDGHDRYCIVCKKAKRLAFMKTPKGLYEYRSRIIVSVLRPTWFPGDIRQIDHRFSLALGYRRQVPLNIINNRSNLRAVDASYNRRKGSRCSITYDQLQREAQPDPFLDRVCGIVGKFSSEQLQQAYEVIKSKREA